MKYLKPISSQNLVNLGLSSYEAVVYQTLLEEGSLSAKEVAKKVNVLPNAVYRLMDRLQNKGFIVPLDTRPKKFQALPPSIAIEAFSEQQEKRLEELKIKSIRALTESKPKAPQTRIDIIVSRAEVFSRFVELTSQAKEEILVISIGEQVPDDVKLASRDVLQRGVDVKFLFHLYNKDNRELLRSWVKMGIEVRHYPNWGFHLIVFDGKKSILVANNPEETAERTGMIIYSEGISKALRGYFYSVWEKAIKIEA